MTRARAVLCSLALLVGAGPLVGAILAVAQDSGVDLYLDIPAGGGPVRVGAPPEGLESIDAEACGECHEAAYREWASSRHRASYTDPIFEREHALRRSETCATCHGPRVERRADGVDCATCHVRDGFVLNPTLSGRAPHAGRVTPELSHTMACARCHEFEFPSRPERQQSTLSEWTASASPGRDETCQTCHVPSSGGRHRHDLPGVDDPALLRSALRVSARGEHVGERSRLTFELRGHRVGHAVPTGDLFRALVVRAWPEGHEDQAVEARLTRRVTADRIIDERVPPPPAAGRTVRLDVPRAPRVRYVVQLHLMRERDARAGGFSRTETVREMARGRITPTR